MLTKESKYSCNVSCRQYGTVKSNEKSDLRGTQFEGGDTDITIISSIEEISY